ncbi:putative quinol monooxygenase [Companilactobacillus huachuanensis]|uniref:Quinol monooxygenase n=1 Tax=Companilactobacillus huachuanensis TaxID=2559914 RepID=A0ABW1RMD5_9LACO|nr:antibiotic biosynthesis monooxygenase [Companilactobacillus huachuanensis]
MRLTEIPILRMYHLTIDESQREVFETAGVQNLLTSHQNEIGTLAMYATHLNGQETENYVFELYQDESQYQIHANSSQFKAYGQVAQKVVKDKGLQELQPQYIQTSNSNMAVSGQNDYFIELTTFTSPSDTVQKLVEKLAKTSISGTYYVAAVDAVKKQWLCLELLRENQVSQISSILDQAISSDRITKLLKVDTMVSQANIGFENSH